MAEFVILLGDGDDSEALGVVSARDREDALRRARVVAAPLFNVRVVPVPHGRRR
jgi:hypothetical protein